jgi:hypothetical protein
MRPAIERLDVSAMPWTPLGRPGLYSKLLSRDPDTGARTALQRMVPEEGLQPPSVAHFHRTYEEILGVRGMFTFDCKRWVKPWSYVFHPPGTVHGFKSRVPQESWFLSRVGRDLDVTQVPEPDGDDPYYVDVVPDRAVALVANPDTERDWTNPSWNRGALAVREAVLSRDPHTGEGSALVQFPAGWSQIGGDWTMAVYLEVFVLSGALQIGPVTLGELDYSFTPPGVVRGELSSPGGALAYVNFGGPIEFSPA